MGAEVRHEGEKDLDDKAIDEMRAKVKTWAEKRNALWWEVILALVMVYRSNAFKRWGITREKWIEEEVGMGQRTFQAKLATYERLKLLGFLEEPFRSKTEALPWTKAEVLARLVEADDLDVWLDRAKDNSRKVLERLVKMSKVRDDEQPSSIQLQATDEALASLELDRIMRKYPTGLLVVAVYNGRIIIGADKIAKLKEVIEPKPVEQMPSGES